MDNTSIVADIVPGKGEHYDICFLDFNIDIESGICSVAVNQTTGETNKSDACTYCYALRLFKKNGPYKVKRIRESVFSKLKARIPEFTVLRIGKNFECGSKLARRELISVLELCVKHAIRPIVTSKILEYDERVAALVLQANGVIHISLGDDSLEKGAVMQGFSNAERYENAKKYSEAGVRCGVRVVEDITAPMPEFLRRIYSDGFHILLTPLYYKDRKLFSEKRPDLTWEEAKSRGIFKFEHGALHPVIVHDDWKGVRERCGTINGKMYCNNCSLRIVHFSDEVGTSKSKYKEKLLEYGWNT